MNTMNFADYSVNSQPINFARIIFITLLELEWNRFPYTASVCMSMS